MQNSAVDILNLGQFTGSQFPFYVNSIKAHLKTSHAHIEKPHRHDFFATIFFEKGSGIHEIDFTRFEVRPGSVFLLSPGQIHNWQLSDTCDGVIFFHTREFFDTQFLSLILSDFRFFSIAAKISSIELETSDMEPVGNLFNELRILGQQDFPKKQLMLVSIITQIYIFLERKIEGTNLAHSSKSSAYQQQFRNFSELLELHFRRQRSVQFYADRLHLSSKHLNRINRHLMNKTTSELLLNRVMLEAKRMLIYANGNLSGIAEELGYLEYAHFSKQFKNHTGCSPKEFLQKYK